MHWEFVAAGYAIVLTGMLAYAVAIVRRGRALSRDVPPDRRRFLG